MHAGFWWELVIVNRYFLSLVSSWVTGWGKNEESRSLLRNNSWIHCINGQLAADHHVLYCTLPRSHQCCLQILCPPLLFNLQFYPQCFNMHLKISPFIICFLFSSCGIIWVILHTNRRHFVVNAFLRPLPKCSIWGMVDKTQSLVFMSLGAPTHNKGE